MATLALCLLFIGRVLSTHDLDPQAFILQKPPDRPLSENWDIGYDGQWYYEIARDPLGAAPRLDQPAYRYQRIVFPLLVWAVSMGQAVWVPWAMLAVNLTASLVVTVVLGTLLVRRRASPWFALALVFSLGYLFALRTDLLEPLALALALGGLLAYETERRGLGLVLFALGGLTKEFALAFPAGLALATLARRDWRASLRLALSSAVPYLAWLGFLWARLGMSEKALAQARPLWVPLLGFRYLTDGPSRLIVLLWVLVPAVLAGALAFRSLRNQAGPLRSQDAFLVLANVALVATMPRLTWVDPLAVVRVALGLLAAMILWSASTKPRLLPYLAALYMPSGLVLALMPGFL